MLNEENATGLNPKMAESNIDSFFLDASSARRTLNDAYDWLFESLYDTWASEKAVAFSKTYSMEIQKLIASIGKKIDVLSQNAMTAYNIVARANDSPTIEAFRDVKEDGKYFDPNRKTENNLVRDYTLRTEINGIKGINITLVRDYIQPEFRNQIIKAIRMFESLPTEIKLFDTENSQKNAYSSGIKEFIVEIGQLSSGIEKSLSDAISTEINRAELAKQQSSEVLNG